MSEFIKTNNLKTEEKNGQVMIDNPDLPFEFVHEILLATEEVKQGMVKKYVRRTKR
jgi:hypothetical protein